LKNRSQTIRSSAFQSDLWLPVNVTCQCFILIVQLFY